MWFVKSARPIAGLLGCVLPLFLACSWFCLKGGQVYLIWAKTIFFMFLGSDRKGPMSTDGTTLGLLLIEGRLDTLDNRQQSNSLLIASSINCWSLVPVNWKASSSIIQTSSAKWPLPGPSIVQTISLYKQSPESMVRTIASPKYICRSNVIDRLSPESIVPTVCSNLK